MRSSFAVLATGLALGFGFGALPALADVVTNGNFETGTLSGFTTYNTANGADGTGLPNVVTFNTTGTGASDAAHFNVGTTTPFRAEGGAGLSQTITISTPGQYLLFENVASQDSANGTINADAGLFSILLNGSVVASDYLGSFGLPYQVLRGNVSALLTLTDGTYLLQTQVTRLGGTAGTATPDEYIDNLSLTATTPEPSSWSLLGTGVLAAGAMLRKKRFGRLNA